jgi:hypothetical protein
MAEEKQWEYRVQTIGGVFSTKDEQLEITLNEWGEEGWEAVNVYLNSTNSSKVTIVAKRPLGSSERRRRSMPNL